MINPNIASKVFQIFSQMAKTNFSIAVDEDNVKDLSTTEWRIIQEVGYGESNKEIAAKLFLSEGTAVSYTHLDVYKRQVHGTCKTMGCIRDSKSNCLR